MVFHELPPNGQCQSAEGNCSGCGEETAVMKHVVDVAGSRRWHLWTQQCLRASAWCHWLSDRSLQMIFATSWTACLLLDSGIIIIVIISNKWSK